jgi:hypothetical protein
MKISSGLHVLKLDKPNAPGIDELMSIHVS